MLVKESKGGRLEWYWIGVGDASMNSFIYIYMCCIYMLSPSSVYMREPRSSDTLEAISTPSTWILVSKNHYPIKEIRVSWRSGKFQGWGRKNTR